MKLFYYLLGSIFAIVFLSGGGFQRTHGIDVNESMECFNMQSISKQINIQSELIDILSIKASKSKGLNKAVINSKIKKAKIKIDKLLPLYDNWSKLCIDSVK